MSLRGCVGHGRAPNVYEADGYHKYFETWGDDPIHDLELIAARSLKTRISDNALVERPKPYSDALRNFGFR